MKFKDDPNGPEKFMESEENLYDFLRSQIMPLSAVQNQISIENFCEANGIQQIIEIMEHENTDISIACAIQLIKELTDEEIEYS